MDETEKPQWSMYDISDYNQEHELFRNSVVEFNDIAGIEIDYYIRDQSLSSDYLYGERTNTSYLTAKRTKVVYEPTEEPTITGPFGINSEEMIQYAFMPKYTFSRDVSASYEPRPGDVIKTIWNSRNYEVVDVDEESHIFQLKKQIWGFLLKPFRFSEESDSSRGILISPDNTESTPLTGYGDNEEIEDESDTIDTYSDVDTSVYGY